MLHCATRDLVCCLRKRQRVQRCLSALTRQLPRDAVVLLGIPTDCNSSFMTGARKAPDLIRQALRSESSNSWSVSPPLSVTDHPRFVDGGDLQDIGGGAGGFC